MKDKPKITKICCIITKDLAFIKAFADKLYPYSIWVDKARYITSDDINNFIYFNGAEKEKDLLMNGDIDYIVIEYDMFQLLK